MTEDSHEVRLRFRVSDIYLVGWFDRDGRYNYLGLRDEAQVPAEPRRGPDGRPLEPRQLIASPSYVNPQTQGNVSRYTMKYGRVETENHAMSLWNADGSEASRTRAAAAAVYFAQFVCEATRLRDTGEWLEERAFGEEDWESYNMHTTIDRRLVDEQNEWGRISDHFARAQANPEGFDPSEDLLTVWTVNSRGDLVEQTLRWAYQVASVLYVANAFPGYSLQGRRPDRRVRHDRQRVRPRKAPGGRPARDPGRRGGRPVQGVPQHR